MNNTSPILIPNLVLVLNLQLFKTSRLFKMLDEYQQPSPKQIKECYIVTLIPECCEKLYQYFLPHKLFPAIVYQGNPLNCCIPLLPGKGGDWVIPGVVDNSLY